MLPDNLSIRLHHRKLNNNYRELSSQKHVIDFYSNDYLGYAKNNTINTKTKTILQDYNYPFYGATGSRLISGNYNLIEDLELKAKVFFESEATMFFNAGYTANLGLLSAVLQPKDIVLYDEYCHASIRDGLLMSKCRAYKFKHNNTTDLIQKINRFKNAKPYQNLFIITESVFSMDGDTADVAQMVDISKENNAYLILDEAHAVGVCGKDFKGLGINYNKNIFARIVTCGKSLGSHGAFLLTSKALKEYLINFSRAFIYTTAVSPHQVAQVMASLDYFERYIEEKQDLQNNISIIKTFVNDYNLQALINTNNTAVQTIKTPGNIQAKRLEKILQQKGIGVKAILSPTVPKGKERIRLCIHSYNTENQFNLLFSTLQKNV